MAQMLPRQVFDKTVSRAERRLFAKIKVDLDDRWTVLHSLGFVGHPRKPWAEIDFVLIGPPGIFCLEVKGGRVHREDGAWVFTDRVGNATIKREGPFDQVGSATAALRALILNRLPGVGHAPIEYGVVVPDIPWTVDGPDTPKQLVCDSNDMRSPSLYTPSGLQRTGSNGSGGVVGACEVWIPRNERQSSICCGETLTSDLRCRLNWGWSKQSCSV